jgi:hypothetical protein
MLLPSIRFEASITASTEGFTGRILDAAFPGPATIAGYQNGREIRFTKTYTSAPSAERTLSSDYRGELSEDGKHLKGTWRIKIEGRKINLYTVHGLWEARRMWNENAESGEHESRAEAGAIQTQTAVVRDAR